MLCIYIKTIWYATSAHSLSKHTGATTTHDGETTIQCRCEVGQHIAESIGQWLTTLHTGRLFGYRIDEYCLSIHFAGYHRRVKQTIAGGFHNRKTFAETWLLSLHRYIAKERSIEWILSLVNHQFIVRAVCEEGKYVKIIAKQI